MARRKRRYTRRPVKRRRARRNPSRARTYARRAGRRVASSWGGLSFKRALKDMVPTQLGMFAAKWAAKRFDPDASETDPESWDWSSYLKGSLGAVGAALLAGSFKGGMGQKVLEGGLNLMVYKAIQNEVIAGSDWASGQFGQDAYVPDEYEGMLLTGEQGGSPFMLAEDGEYYPADDDYRMQGDTMEPVGPLGQVPSRLEPVGPLGDPYARVFFDD